MITTIEVSPYISVQGVLVSNLPGGDVEVSLNGRSYVGRPIRSKVSAAADPQDA